MEKRPHVFVCQLFAHHSYPEFDEKLRELRAISLMHSIWAARTVLTAKELKEALRKTLDDGDRILVVEVSGGWASRRAQNNLGELLPPRGGPALALWTQRWENEKPRWARVVIFRIQAVSLLGRRRVS